MDGFAGSAAESHRSPRESTAPRWPMFEPLEARLLLNGDGLTAAIQGGDGLGGIADIHKLMVAGDPNGSPADSPVNRIDANTTSSLYAGVGSLMVDATAFDGYTYIGSATAISPTHVLTAAHMLDLDNNGTIDVNPADVAFILNYGSDFSHVIAASAFSVHSDWTGFSNPSTNDDVAVIELSVPLPTGVPIYQLNTDPFINIETVTMVGYGLSGDGVNGYTVSPSYSVKRVGSNRADVYISDDEGGASREGWEFDFDGSSKNTNLFGRPRGSNLTLGNDIETTLGGGDSGGPAFIDDGFGGIEIFGVNTFGFTGKADAPFFGSGGGGIVVAAYAEWIQSVVDSVPPPPPPPPSPGISVTPSSGLVTSEDGGIATFDVVLDTQPTTDVIIDLSSSDTSEGIVDQSSLTFTSLNWDTAQTVTVTGIDDGDLDGDVAYTIVTVAAISGDTDYDGLNAADVSATNLDNEAPAETLAITKATYNSKKDNLTVEATSSLGGGTSLTATFFVGEVESSPHTMSYSARKNKWSVTFNSLTTKPQKVRVYSGSTYVEKTNIGGKSTTVATAYAMHAANIKPKAIADSPVGLPRTGRTPATVAARQQADVSVPLTVVDLPPMAVSSTTTGSRQSRRSQLVDLLSGDFEDAPGGESVAEMDLDLHVLGGDLLGGKGVRTILYAYKTSS